jgi:hypothetical protein
MVRVGAGERVSDGDRSVEFGFENYLEWKFLAQGWELWRGRLRANRLGTKVYRGDRRHLLSSSIKLHSSNFSDFMSVDCL